MMFGGRNINSTHSINPYHSINDQAIFLFLTPNFHSSSRMQFWNNSEDIQLFNWDQCQQGKFLTPLKHLGFFDFSMTNIRCLSSNALQAARKVRHTLLFFPPEHFWRLKGIVFLAWLYKMSQTHRIQDAF